MKLKTIYICQNCGQESTKWLGRCPSCDAWNSFVEEVINTKAEKTPSLSSGKASPISSLSHAHEEFVRTKTGISELDQVLGGGIVAGSLILLGGEPGIGKSTLTLQICDKISENLNKIIYISGEESASQISSRAKRLNIKSAKIYLVNEVNLENIFKTVEQNEPSLIIIDSIQVIYSENLNSNAGSISQIRFCTEKLMNFAKKNKIPIILIGHVTKEGQLAGPRVLEHLVDTVLNFEGDRYQHFRILRAIKNRFGSTQEAGIFEMTEQGLQEISNPSGLFLQEKIENSFGTCLTCAIEGNRAFLLEVQALTNTTPFGYPKRASSGFDVNRLELLIAVLQKHANLNLSNQDVYINVVSGFKLKEPAADLAICLAIISSLKKSILPPNTLAIGEIGLTGEIRTPNFIEKRIQEAQRFKIPKIFGPVIKDKKIKNYIDIKSIKESSTHL